MSDETKSYLEQIQEAADRLGKRVDGPFRSNPVPPISPVPPIPPESPESQVMRYLNTIAVATASLYARLGELVQRLEPVLRPSDPEAPNKTGAGLSAAQSPLAAMLDAHLIGIDTLSRLVEDAHRRLDLP